MPNERSRRGQRSKIWKYFTQSQDDTLLQAFHDNEPGTANGTKKKPKPISVDVCKSCYTSKQNDKNVKWLELHPNESPTEEDLLLTASATAKCALRGQGGTSHMWAHLRNIHQIQPGESEDEDVDSTSNIASTSEVPKRRKRQLTLDRHVVPMNRPADSMKKWSEEWTIPASRLAQLFYGNFLPFATVESTTFKTFCHALNPRFLPPTRSELRYIIHTHHQELRQEICQELLAANTISLTTDGWTAVSNDRYVTITAQFINDSFTMRKFVLTTLPVPESHTARNIREFIISTLKSFDVILLTKISAVVTDRAQNFLSATIGLGCFESFCHVHLLNTIMKKALSGETQLPILIKKALQFIHNVRKSSTLYEALRALQRDQSIVYDLLPHIETRFNIVYICLERLLKLRCFIDSLAIEANLDYHLTSDDWALLETLNPIIKLFYNRTVELSSSSKPTLPLVVPCVRLLTAELTKRFANASIPCIKNVCSKLLSRLKTHFDLDSPTVGSTKFDLSRMQLLFVACFLHPLDRKLDFLSHSSRSVIHEQLFTLMSKYGSVPSHQLTEQAETETEPSEWQNLLPNLAAHVDTRDALISELQYYINTDFALGAYFMPEQQKNHVTFLLDEFWKDNEKAMPNLSKVVKTIFAIPASSIPSESTFSSTQLFLNKRRASLRPSKVDEMVFLYTNTQSMKPSAPSELLHESLPIQFSESHNDAQPPVDAPPTGHTTPIPASTLGDEFMEAWEQGDFPEDMFEFMKAIFGDDDDDEQ